MSMGARPPRSVTPGRSMQTLMYASAPMSSTPGGGSKVMLYQTSVSWTREFPFGKYGVQLFFMLSGFVNAMTLLKKRKSADFLASRIIRICPIRPGVSEDKNRGR